MKDGYENFCRLMATQLFYWKHCNPDASISIQWNYGPKVAIVGAITDAITKNLVTLNDGAKRMLSELGWTVDCQATPTVNQVRIIIEAIYGSADEAEPSSGQSE